MALMMAYTRFDGLMLERIHADGAIEAARYASGYRLLEAVSMFAALFAGLLLPMFSRMLAENRDITPLAALGTRLMLIPALAFAAFCVAYRETLMPLMNHRPEVISDPGFSRCLPCLMCTLIPYCCIYIFGTLVTAKGAIRELNRLAVICLVLNIALNLGLIPLFRGKGAAWSTSITQSLFAVGNISAQPTHCKTSRHTYLAEDIACTHHYRDNRMAKRYLPALDCWRDSYFLPLPCWPPLHYAFLNPLIYSGYYEKTYRQPSSILFILRIY